MQKKLDKVLFDLKSAGQVAKAATDKTDSRKRTVARMLMAIDSKSGGCGSRDSELSGKEVGQGLVEMMDWEESQHPRGKGGKFVKKGSGGSGGGSSGGSSNRPTGVKALNPVNRGRNKKALAESLAREAKACAEKAEKWPEGSGERHQYELYADIFSKPLQGRPTPEESEKMTKEFLSKISTQLKPAAVDRYKRDLANEPKITSDLCDISESIGTGMFGLGFRLKKASDSSDGGCRIAEKIAEDMEDAKRAGHPITYEQAVGNLSDMVRYTQACTADNLADNFHATNRALIERGYKPVKVKNTWDSYNVNNAYRGVNCVYMSPTGTKFELQFHTPESLAGKEVQHGQYEEQRSPRTPEARKKELGEMMYKNMSSLKTPTGISRIKNFKRKA